MKKITRYALISFASVAILQAASLQLPTPLGDGGIVYAEDVEQQPISVAVIANSEGDGPLAHYFITINPGETKTITAPEIDGYKLDQYTDSTFELTYDYASNLVEKGGFAWVQFLYIKSTDESVAQTPPADNLDGGSDNGEAVQQPRIAHVGAYVRGTFDFLGEWTYTVNPGEYVTLEPRQFDGYVANNGPSILRYEDIPEDGLHYDMWYDKVDNPDTGEEITPPKNDGSGQGGNQDQTPPEGGEENLPPQDGSGSETDNKTPEPGEQDGGKSEIPPTPETPAPKVLTDQDRATFAEIARLYDEVIALGGKPWHQFPGIVAAIKSGDDERMTQVLHNFENIQDFVTLLENQLIELKKTAPTPAPKDLAADRNKLLLSLDESGLTDQQKGELAVKITFAETEQDLAALKAEFVKLVEAAGKSADKATDKPAEKSPVKVAAAAKPAASTPAKSDKAALPATGDVTRVGLIAAGFSLLLLGLGLAKSRKHN